MLSALGQNSVNNKESEPDDLMIFCTRPGCSIWKASVYHGEVVQRLQYKETNSESLNMNRKLSSTELPTVEHIGVNETKLYSKNKSISHSFSLIYNQRIKNLNDEHSANILVTSNATGLYFISLDDLRDINFIRLDRKVGSILKIVLDPHFDGASIKKNENLKKPRQPGIDKDGNLIDASLETEDMKPFPVYVLDSFNGFVQRFMIQPQFISSNERFDDILNENCEEERKNANTENSSSMVSFYFSQIFK